MITYLGTYTFENEVWYLWYYQESVSASKNHPDGELPTEITGSVDHASQYIDFDPRPPLAEAVVRLKEIEVSRRNNE